MHRRSFLLSTAGALSASAAAPSATVLYGDRAVPIAQIRPDPKALWIRAADLPAVNEFELKPQGACRADMCIPVPKELKSGQWFNLSGFAQRLHQSVVSDSGVWSFGEIPVLRGDFYRTRIAPDFAVPDRRGR